MARDTCVRCGVTLHSTTTPPGKHLCKDKAARLARRQKQVDATVRILALHRGSIQDLDLVPVAEAIVAKLAGMGVTDDA